MPFVVIAITRDDNTVPPELGLVSSKKVNPAKDESRLPV
jgi:hypothetical protein